MWAREDILFSIFSPPTRAKKSLSDLVDRTIYWVSPKDNWKCRLEKSVAVVIEQYMNNVAVSYVGCDFLFDWAPIKEAVRLGNAVCFELWKTWYVEGNLVVSETLAGIRHQYYDTSLFLYVSHVAGFSPGRKPQRSVLLNISISISWESFSVLVCVCVLVIPSQLLLPRLLGLWRFQWFCRLHFKLLKETSV